MRLSFDDVVRVWGGRELRRLRWFFSPSGDFRGCGQQLKAIVPLCTQLGYTLEIGACSAAGRMVSFADTTPSSRVWSVHIQIQFTTYHTHYTTFFLSRPFQMCEYEKKFP